MFRTHGTRTAILSAVLGVMFIYWVPGIVNASDTNGTIDATNKYSKICKDTTCTTFGNVNWRPTINSNTPGAVAVAVTDSGLSGHIWGDEVGWIKLDATSSGVTVNPNTGVLSGKAFASVGSWINFSPTTVSGGTTVGVVINSTGQFVGWAYVSGVNGGWMKFDCAGTGTCVQTDWRPIPNRTSTSGGGGIVGGGSGGSFVPSGDICPNIAGTQTILPVGYGMNAGTCVLLPTPATPSTTNPAQPSPTVPTTNQISNQPSNQPTPTTTPNTSSSFIPQGTVDETQGASSDTFVPPTPSFTQTPGSATDPFEGLGIPPNTFATLDPQRPGAQPIFRMGDRAKVPGVLYIETTSGGLVFDRVNVPLTGPSGIILNYLELPAGSTANVGVRAALKGYPRGVARIDTKVTRVAAMPSERSRRIIPVPSLFERFIIMVFSVALPARAYAAELTPAEQDALVTRKTFTIPEKPGIYTLTAAVTYVDNTREEKQESLLVLERGEVYTRKALLLPFESPVVSVVSVFRQNDETNVFEPWDASLYDQNNSQWTRADGTYSIVVPRGSYQVKYAAHGYDDRVISGIDVVGRESKILNDKVELVCHATASFMCMWDIKLIAFLLLIGALWHRREKRITAKKGK